MDTYHTRTDLPVILLYDLDPSWTSEEIEERQVSARQLDEGLTETGHPVRKVCVQSRDLETVMGGIDPDEYVVLNWCEGFPGIHNSDCQVARSLEHMRYTFTGASSRSLALSQDKRRIKRVLQRHQIPTPVWKVFTSSDASEWMHFPAIVKPAFEHCSYGITNESVVLSPAELIHRIQYVLDEMKEPALVEEFIDSRELHVGVVGNGELTVLPPGEIDYSGFTDIHDRLCTYESNVDKSSLAYRLTAPKLPVDLPGDQLSQLEATVIAAYRAVRCRDYARLDLRLLEGVFYVLDVNPNPDISADTSLVLGAALDGYSYGALASLFVNLAAQRHPVFGPAF